MRSKLLKGTMAVCGLAVAAAMLTGCQQNLKDQNARLMEENRGLRDQLADRGSALESSHFEASDCETRVADLQRRLDDANASLASASYSSSSYSDTQYASGQQQGSTQYTSYPSDQYSSGGQGVVGQYSAPIANPFGGIDGVSGSVGAGEITATLEADVLFDPGKSSLKKGARQSLNAIITVLNSTYAARTIRVSGHTDTDPIRKSGFKSNYHLGFERAYAVREYLVKQGVVPSRLYVASYGPEQAMPTKKESRRVEISVVLNDS